MINEILFMNGYGVYVWSSFIFTLSCFGILYSVVKIKVIKIITVNKNLNLTFRPYMA